MMQRRTFRIAEIGRVVTGKTPSTADTENFGSDFPFLTPTDMHGTKWARSTERGLSVIGAGKLRCKVPAGAVAVSCIGWQMGKSILIDRPSYTNQQINTIIPNDHVSAEYLYYYLATRREELLSIGAAGGVRTPIISKSAFEAIEIALPDLPVQHRVASILSAYDDLIENNTRRIAIVEEMVRRIYEEWFVRFRFPGHDQVKMLESELGLIPEGWQVTSLQDYCSIVSRGVTPKYQPGSGRFVINQKANRGSELLFSELKELMPDLAVPAEKYARFGDVLVNSLGEGTIGRVHYFSGPDNQWAVDQHMTICRCRDSGAGFALYQYLSSEAGQAKIASVKTGATSMTMLNISSLRDFEVLRPPLQIIQKFWDLCSPNVQLKAVLQQKNANLRATRDLLLPKLISGELDVSTLPEPEEAIAA